MYFKETYFYNFRNIQPERREWPVGLNLITGPNGAGKTNFLEGLNLISGWGPLEKSTVISDIIRWNGMDRGDRASLWGRVSGEEDSEIFASVTVRCSLKFDGKSSAASAVRSRIPVLSWLSGSISLIKGGASHRRALLDRVGALISPSYAGRLHDYRYFLRQKTALLRKSRDAAIMERSMLRVGAWLWTAREEILRMIAESIDEFEELLPRPVSLTFKRGGAGMDEKPLDDFKKSLSFSRDREKAAKIPLVGPQRDDIGIFCGPKEASVMLSRGQSSRVASALILASALVVERVLGRKPVLVFDEMASELDADGKLSTIEALGKTGCQIFAAATDPIFSDGVKLHNLRDGRFVRE
ncbi:MAG: DNA replication and repair protein RecF [Synergistaceae bacterium]|jgi:DNA replication and repair protein RecF|nr:DNA replication and repair protein RecF [Synergistaceae bacterium]